MNGNLMLKTGKIEVPGDRYMAPPPSRKGDATYLSLGTIVLFSCETGGDGKFAQTISMDETFHNIRVIAPADVVTIYEDGTASVDNNKTWVEYVNGQENNNYNGRLIPGTEEFETSSYWERIQNTNNYFK